jgi:hypothetical protein
MVKTRFPVPIPFRCGHWCCDAAAASAAWAHRGSTLIGRRQPPGLPPPTSSRRGRLPLPERLAFPRVPLPELCTRCGPRLSVLPYGHAHTPGQTPPTTRPSSRAAGGLKATHTSAIEPSPGATSCETSTCWGHRGTTWAVSHLAGHDTATPGAPTLRERASTGVDPPVHRDFSPRISFLCGHWCRMSWSGRHSRTGTAWEHVYR